MSQQKIVVIYLAALMAFGAFSTDIYLASMPTIQTTFNTTSAFVQLTLSLFFVTYGVTQLFWGPLSDRVGRKPVVLIGVLFFLIASLLCALSTSIDELIIFRVIQSVGACAGAVMSIAIAKDIFSDPTERSNVLSTMTVILMLAPMVAPIIGSYLLHHLGWRSNFYFLSIYGAVIMVSTLFIKESYPKAVRKPLPANKLYSAHIDQVTFKPFLLATLSAATNYSILFAFVAASPFIYIKLYHLPAYLFGYLYAVNAMGLIVGSLTLKKVKNKISDRQIIIFSTLLSAVSAIVMLILIMIYPNFFWCIVIPGFFVTYGVGILFPELMGQALSQVVEYTGIASSLQGTVRFMIAAVIGFLMGIIIVETALPLPIMMLTLSIMTLLLMLIFFKITPPTKSE